MVSSAAMNSAHNADQAVNARAMARAAVKVDPTMVLRRLLQPKDRPSKAHAT
jgi:hypothetical protein